VVQHWLDGSREKGSEYREKERKRLLSSKSQDDGDNLINNVPEGIKAALIITAHWLSESD
jgi:hypothetical protein